MPRIRKPYEGDGPRLSLAPDKGSTPSLLHGDPEQVVTPGVDALSTRAALHPAIAGIAIKQPNGVMGETGYGDVRSIAMILPTAEIEQRMLFIETKYPILSNGDRSVFVLTEAVKIVQAAAVDSLTGTSPLDHLLERTLMSSMSTDEEDIDMTAAREWSSLDELGTALAFFPRGDEVLIEPVIEKWPSQIWGNPDIKEALLESLNQTYSLILIAEHGINHGVSKTDAALYINSYLNRLKEIIVTDVIGYSKQHGYGKGKNEFDKYMSKLSRDAWAQWRAEYAPDDPDDGVGRELLAA